MAGEALSKTASATSLTIAFHKKCDKEWRKLRDKLEAQFQEDIGRLYAKSLYWDLEVVVNCKNIRTHHSILQVRAPKFFSHLCATREPSSPNSRYTSAALEKASVDYLESFIRNIYVKNSIEDEESSVVRYLDNILIDTRKFDSGFGESEKNDSILSPESDIYVTPKTSPSEIIEQFGLINKDYQLSKGNGDRIIHSSTSFLPLDKIIRESSHHKEDKSSEFVSIENSLFPSSLSAKSPISDRDAQASYYSIVPVDDVCREERPRHLDLRGRGFSPAFSNTAGEALEKELAEQDELLKSFQSILSKEGGKSDRTKLPGRRFNPVGRSTQRLGIPVRDNSRSKESLDRIPRPSREVSRRDGGRGLGTKSKDVSVSRLPVRKQQKRVNTGANKNTNEKYSSGSSLDNSNVPLADQDISLSYILSHSCKKDIKPAVSLDIKPSNPISGPVLNHQDGTGSEMDGVADYHEELGRQFPLKLSSYSCEAEEEEEDFLCSACSPCSPDMEGGVSSSQQDSGLDTGTSGSGGNPPPGGGATAGDPTPSDATSATTSSSWHCLHSVSSPLLPRDPSVPHLLSPSFVSSPAEGNGEALGILPGAECNSIVIGEDDTEAAVLSKLKSSSVSVSSGAVSDTDDVGIMEYDESDVRCENVSSVKHVISNVDETNKNKESVSFSNSMTKSIEVYHTYESVSQKGSEVALPLQESVVGVSEISSLKLTNGMDGFCEEGRSESLKLECETIRPPDNFTDSSLPELNGVTNGGIIPETKMESSSPAVSTITKVQINGDAICGIDNDQYDRKIEDVHESVNCDIPVVYEPAKNKDGSVGKNTKTEAQVSMSNIHCTEEGAASEVGGESTAKITQHFFIDAATLLDDSEFVPSSLDSVQQDIEEPMANINSYEKPSNASKLETEAKELNCTSIMATSLGDQPSSEKTFSENTAKENHERNSLQKDEDLSDVKVDLPHQDVLHDASSSKMITIVEKFQQEIFVSQTCAETVPSMPVSESKQIHSSDSSHETEKKTNVHQLENANQDKDIKSKSVGEIHQVTYESSSSETCKMVEPKGLIDVEHVKESSILKKEVLRETFDINEPNIIKAADVSLISGEVEAPEMHSLKKFVDGAHQPDLHITEEVIVTSKDEIIPQTDVIQVAAKVSECVGQESFKKVIPENNLKSKNDVLPPRTGELIRGDTFELKPGEERVTWFRQEHERRQGSMLFQGLQRRSSVDSINKVDQVSSSNYVRAEKLSNQNIMHPPSQFCASSMSLTQSLPPMLSTGMTIPAPPTPPNTLHRVKNHNQPPAVPLTTATVDTIHKLFGDQRIQNDVDPASPLQRFSQRLRPSREEDIQSPDSLNNDGPMETFCRDSVLINRITAPASVASAETGEEEEENGPIVEKQTDEYLEKERRDDDDLRPVVSGALTDSDVALNPVITDNPKRQKRTESTPIVSGGASAADFAQISPSRPADSPMTRRRTETTPILSGGGPPLEEPKKESHPSGSPRCPRRWDGTPPPLSAWVVDMSDCCKGDSSNFGPSSLNSSWSPSTPEARKRHRRRRSEGMPFTVGNRGLRAVEFSEQPADEVTPTDTVAPTLLDTKEASLEHDERSSENPTSGSGEDSGSEKKKALFSMFIDIGDSCKPSGTKGKEGRRPRELSSAMSASWQGNSSHSKSNTDSTECVNKNTSVKPNEGETSKGSDMTKSGPVFMYIDASQPPKPKTEPEKETKPEEPAKEENTSQAGGHQRERQGFFMFIEAEPTPPVMRKPFLLKDGHLTSTPPSKRHSWNQEVPNILEGMVGQVPSVRRHKRTQSLSVVGRSSSGSSVPHLLESASGEDSDHASRSASISSVSVGQASTSVAGSSLSLVDGGLDSGSSTGEFKSRGPIVKARPLIGSSPENMGSSLEGSSKCHIPEEDYEEKTSGKNQSKIEKTCDLTSSIHTREELSNELPANGESVATTAEVISSPVLDEQKKSSHKNEEEHHHGKKSLRPLNDSQMSDIKESTEEETKKQFVKLSDLDKGSTASVDVEGVMIESCESFGNEDILSSSSGSRRVRPVEEMSWIESKARQGVCGGGSRGRLLYPIGLGKGTGRSRRGRSESPGKNGSNSGGSPAPLHREVAEEQPLSESASALSSMQSSVDRSALEGSTEETDMSSSLGGSRSAPCSRLGQDLLRMFLDEVNTDVTVEVEGHSVRAHKCILSSRCQYFAAMLSGGWVESAGNVISLQGFSYSAVHFALCHIYSGTSNIPETISIVELATLADMLGLEGLKEVIMYTLKVKYCHFFHKPCAVCAVGVLECLPLAAAYGLDEIYRKSLKWITKYFIRIWPSKAFAALPRELIDKCYHQHVVHMSVENILDTVMCCDKLLATLPNVRWAEPVFGITSQLLEASVKFIADNFSGVVLSDKFQSLGKELSWNISRLEESVAGAADMLSLEQACLSYINISHLLSSSNSPEQETHEMQWSTNFVDFLRRLETRVEGRLVRGAGRVARCRSWMQLDAQVRRRIQEKACLVGLDHSSGGSSRRRRVGGEEEDGGSSSGCGGSDDTGGSIGRRGRSRHSSLLRQSEQRPASARSSASSSIYCTIPRSSSGRAKGKESLAATEARNKAGNGAPTTNSTVVPSQSQAIAAATALLDTKHKPARKERSSSTSVGIVGSRSKSSSSRVHQNAQSSTEVVKTVAKKESSVSSVMTRQKKKASQLDKEKSASAVVGKSDGKPTQPAESTVTRPKTWPMRVMEGKSSRSSPQLQPPNVSTGGISSSTGTPEKAGSISSRVRISSSDSSRNSSPALRPKGVMRGAKTSRTFTPSRITKKPDTSQQTSSSPPGGSQTQLTKDGTASPRRASGAKTNPSRPTPDSASSRASNSPVANLRRASSTTSRSGQPAASVTPTPKRTAWSRTKASGPVLAKQNSSAAVPSPPRTSSVRSGNEIAARKNIPGSKPRTPLAERSTRSFSPKAVAVNGGGSSISSSVGLKKKPGSLHGALIHSRNGSTVSLDKGKGETVAPSGVGERSGTFLKDEPTVLKRPENAGAE